MAADRRDRSVFLNCPFDAAYKPLFDAIVFTVVYCGFEIRSALEASDAGELRLAKVLRLIGESRSSIHDISRIELDEASGLPRFNMPIELGVAIGAKHFGEHGGDHRRLVLDSQQYRYQRFASDLAGLDISPHGGEIDGAIAGTRNFLAAQSIATLPGAVAIRAVLDRFEATLPVVAQAVGQRTDEITYPDRLLHLGDYLRTLR